MFRVFLSVLSIILCLSSIAQQRALMQIQTDRVKNTVSPNLHGIFLKRSVMEVKVGCMPS